MKKEDESVHIKGEVTDGPISSGTFQGPWYHVRILIEDDNGSKEKVGELTMYDLSESALKRGITIPYSQDKKLLFNGRFVDPSDIAGIRIITTLSSIIAEAHIKNLAIVFQYVVDRGKDVTYDFITAPPGQMVNNVAKEEKVIIQSNKVFIVHGHDDSSKNELASFLYKVGLTPIVLHEQPNQGKTVVEKFEQYASDVGYAFVLLTPDDVGGKSKEELKSRARQNVVLELGYFMGKLGRERVCGLYKGSVEIPSDVLGVLYLR